MQYLFDVNPDLLNGAACFDPTGTALFIKDKAEFCCAGKDKPRKLDFYDPICTVFGNYIDLTTLNY